MLTVFSFKNLCATFPQAPLQLIAIFLAVLLTGLIGIWSRPHELLAFFWPANALILALLLRFPKFNPLYILLAAILALAVANIATNNSPALTTALISADLTAIFSILLLLRCFGLHYKQYNQGLTFFYLLILIAIGSAVGALTAVYALPLSSQQFIDNNYLWYEFVLWWTGEMQNYVLFLPIFLAFPGLKQWQHLYKKLQAKVELPKRDDFIPFMLTLISIAGIIFLEHPNSLYLPMAALTWAALRYHLFTIALINLLLCLAFFYSLNIFHNKPNTELYLANVVSMRVGFLMLFISSLTVCLVSTNQRFLFKKLRFLVEHDSLTRAMSRHHFMKSAQYALNHAQHAQSSMAILMIDLDFFKKINDIYGHQVGDLALQHFVQVTQQHLRSSDLFGRLGGEEFAIILQRVSIEQAQTIAQRVQHALVEQPLQLDYGEDLVLQLSIGLVYLPKQQHTYRLDDLLHHADLALYQAKQNGRNQVYTSTTLF